MRGCVRSSGTLRMPLTATLSMHEKGGGWCEESRGGAHERAVVCVWMGASALSAGGRKRNLADQGREGKNIVWKGRLERLSSLSCYELHSPHLPPPHRHHRNQHALLPCHRREDINALLSDACLVRRTPPPPSPFPFLCLALYRVPPSRCGLFSLPLLGSLANIAWWQEKWRRGATAGRRKR